MQIETSGILINIKPFSERDGIARVFTRDNGVLVGLLRGANVARKNKPLVGQCGTVSWNARLDSQLGANNSHADNSISNGCLFSGVSLTLPFTLIAQPFLNEDASS